MIYQEIEKPLMLWANSNGITLVTIDRDWEIRAFLIGSQYVFIDYPKNGKIIIKIYKNKDRKLVSERKIEISNLITELDSLLKS